MSDVQIQPPTEADIARVLDLIMELPTYLRCETLDTLLTTEVKGNVREAILKALRVCREELNRQSTIVLRGREIGRG